MIKRGFTLIELLVVIGIIGIIASVIMIAFSSIRQRSRDTKRITEVRQFGRFLTQKCYMPNDGLGVYDFADILTELTAANPQYAEAINTIPYDPKTGSPTETQYIYEVTAQSEACVLYANLESDSQAITLSALSDPTPGGGTGILNGNTTGANGTTRYYQISN